MARYLHFDGFRKHSRLSQVNAALRLNHKFSEKARIAVFAELMDTVRCCSLGQITQALYDVGGQYRRNM